MDPHCVIYLYGSRRDAASKGGDIDLLLLSETLQFRDKLDLLSILKEKLGDQKIDLTIRSQEQFVKDLFFKEVPKVELTLPAA